MRKRSWAVGLTVVLVLISLLSASCEQGATPTPTPNPEEREAAVSAIVSQAGKVVPLAQEKDVITETETKEEGDFRYTYEKHDVVDNIESVVYLGLNDDIIWPGSLVIGTKANDFVYEPISVDRGPIMISVSLETSTGVGQSITQNVDDPKLSTVRQGISDLLRKAITGDTYVPAKVDFEYQQVYNESQMNLFVGANVSYGAGSLNTKFNWDSTSKKNKIMAKYKQVYYSVDIDTPKSPADVFAPSMTLSEIAAVVPPGSMPLYVASVSYGMMALMFIETDYTEEQMKMALEAEYEGILSGELEFGYTAKQVLDSSTVKIVVYGGSTAGLQDLETEYAGFKKVIEASTDFGPNSPGVPLVYKFRHLADNTLALVTLTSQYTLIKPLQLRQAVRVTVERFRCTLSDDEGAGNDADMDRFNVWATAYNRLNKSEVGSMIGTENQQVFAWSTTGSWTVAYGGIFTTDKPNSVDIIFDTENYDFNSAKLVLKAHAREYDSSSGEEEATVYWEVTGDQFFENGGKHMFILSDYSDFGFEVHITITPLL